MTQHGSGRPCAVVAQDAGRDAAISEISQRVTAAYDLVAAAYADRNVAMSDALIGLGGRALARADVGSGIRVLDVGCGVGRDLAWFRAQGARVIGIDRSAGMLAMANDAVDGGVARMDMQALAFRMGSFDLIWCIAPLLHLPKREAPMALAEMRRVLRPGGVLALSLQEGNGEAWDTGPYTNDPVDTRFFARYTLDEATALLQRGGFSVCERGVDDGRGRQWLRLLAVVGPL